MSYVETQLGFPGIVVNTVAKVDGAGGGSPQDRNSSKQDYSTPWPLIRAIERRFGPCPIAWDLAASAENAKAPNFITEERDTFTVEWHALSTDWLWLNPPFNLNYRFAEKCRAEMLKGARILVLWPASVSTDWYAEHVEHFAHNIGIRPRLKFEGAADQYPKDLMLSVFAHGLTGFSTWRWN